MRWGPGKRKRHFASSVNLLGFLVWGVIRGVVVIVGGLVRECQSRKIGELYHGVVATAIVSIGLLAGKVGIAIRERCIVDNGDARIMSKFGPGALDSILLQMAECPGCKSGVISYRKLIEDMFWMSKEGQKG